MEVSEEERRRFSDAYLLDGAEGLTLVENEEATMNVTSIRQRRADRPNPQRVVAVVLEDGTVQPVDEVSSADTAGRLWQSGRVSGPAWVLWWERRSWDDLQGWASRPKARTRLRCSR